MNSAERLDRWQVSALIIVLAALLAPHGERLPYWLSGVLIALFGWRLWLLHQQWRLPPRWLLWPLTFAIIGGIVVEYHTLLGKSGGVAMLAALVGAKLLETKSRRDALMLVYLGYFLVITNFLFSQTLLMGAYLFTMVVAITALLIGWHSLAPQNSVDGLRALRQPIRLALTLLLQAIPLMAVLFVFFPRIEGPLWRIPSERPGAKSGLADSMSPGSFASMAQSDEVAFRVSFATKMPQQDVLYWRGPVFEDYDGRTWTQRQLSSAAVGKIEALGKPLEYTITLEPHQRQWVLALDLPVKLPDNTRLTDHLQLVTREPIVKRSRYTLEAVTEYRAATEETTALLERALQLPPDTNPRAIATAATWRKLPPAERVNEALRLFSSQRLEYTLTPPLYGPNAVDDFVFQGKQGFCEHFAGAFVFLLRSAGVPARVVGGYQGGDRNGDYLIIRQADAHAWSEVWLEDKGWVRVDPTFAVAPSRIEQGLGSAIPGRDLPMMLRSDQHWIKQLRLVLDAGINHWNQWVIGYTPQQQRKLLQRFGIDSLASSSFLLWFGASLALLSAPLALWLLWRMRPPRIDPAKRLYDRFCRKLAAAGVKRQTAEGPRDFAARAAQALPWAEETIFAISEQYVAIRYANRASEQELLALKLAINRMRLEAGRT